MENKTIPMRRLEEWIRCQKLPRDARTCIENFVLSCDKVNEGDVSNFIDIDIRDFNPRIQEKLVEGFFYAYTGIEGFGYVFDKNGSFYRIGLN